MWRAIASVVVFVSCMWMSGGLKCLQCLDTAAGGPCVHDYEGLVDTVQEDLSNGSLAYYKECPDGRFGVFHNYCVIEEFFVGGDLKSFIRDCSDGGNFSFTGTVDSNKLQDVVPDNYSTCVYILSANTHICISLCEGDFCNGPLPPNETLECDYTIDENGTCSGAAGRWFATSGPFGPIVDRLLGRGYLVPMIVAMLGVIVFGW